MPQLEHLVRPLQEATKLETRQLNLALGLRAAAATFVPLLVGAWAGHPAFHWAGIAGFVATTADKGGPFATRAKTFFALGLASALTVTVGSWLGTNLWVVVPVTFLLVLAGALVRVLGTEAISIGTVTSVLFLIAEAQPAVGLGASLERAGLVAGGVAWAALLALLLWPVRQYAPARKAVAACFDALAVHVDALAAELPGAGSHRWHTLHQKDHTLVRTAIEGARAHLAAIRGNTRALGGKTAWLLGLVQTSDRAFGRVVALTDVLESSGVGRAPEAVRQQLNTSLVAVADACRALAAFAVDENEAASVPRVTLPLDALTASLEALPTALEQAQWRHAVDLLVELQRVLSSAAPVKRPAEDETPKWTVVLRTAMTFESVELRHALRVAVLVAASVGAVELLHVEHGYWATITVLVVLQPHAPATFLRSLQRVGGTVLGALLAVGITAVVHEPAALLPVCAVMAAVSVSVIQVNYALYATLLTPTFLLLAQLDGLNPKLAGVRAVTNVVAGVAALLASRLLWPSTEETRIADELAKAVDALRTLFLTTVKTPRPDDATIEVVRRRFGLLVGNADVSLQRLVAERRLGDAALEPLITLPLYLRRFCWTALTLPTLPGDAVLPDGLVQAFDAALEELAASLRARRAPRELSRMGVDAPTLQPLAARQVDRLMQHLETLHDAATRLATAAASATLDPTPRP